MLRLEGKVAIVTGSISFVDQVTERADILIFGVELQVWTYVVMEFFRECRKINRDISCMKLE